MSNLITDFFEIISSSFSSISDAIISFVTGITTFLSQPAILPDFWECLPSQLQHFFLGFFAINLFVIVLFALFRKS